MGFGINANDIWPDGNIYYRYINTSTGKRKERFEKTLKRWTALLDWTGKDLVSRAGRSPITFVELGLGQHKPNLVAVTFVEEGTSAGCVGNQVNNQKGGTFNCKLGPDEKNYPHEVGHIIGLAHEHMHSQSGIQPADADQVFSMGRAAIENERRKYRDIGRYDPYSIMHYDGKSVDFKRWYVAPEKWGKYKIEPRRDEKLIDDQTWFPSAGDLIAIHKLYRG
jgi:hypothetical protein